MSYKVGCSGKISFFASIYINVSLFLCKIFYNNFVHIAKEFIVVILGRDADEMNFI